MQFAPDHARLQMDSFLVRGVNWLGDAVMSTPALLRLREAYPNTRIALLTPEKLAGLWENHPAIDTVLTFSASESVFAVGRRLRAEQFDAGLVLPNSFRSAFELWRARIPTRVGYTGNLRGWLLTRPVAQRTGVERMRKRSDREIRMLTQGRADGSANDEGSLTPTLSHPMGEGARREGEGTPSGSSTVHHIHQYLHLASQMGASAVPLAPLVFITDRELESVLGGLQPQVRPGQPLFGLNPGAEYGPAKRWPAERFIAAAREIQRRTDCVWLLFGGRGDVDLAGQIAQGIQSGAAAVQMGKARTRVINLAGATSLRELCVLLKACRVLLTNDTGPMHVAAAVGTPVVALFGSTSSALTGPTYAGGPSHTILHAATPCAPCFRRKCPIDLRCLRGIEVSEAVRAVLQATQASGCWNSGIGTSYR